jgi:hypothetical protein
MKIKYSYSQSQLDGAVKFLSKYNSYFTGQDEEIKASIMATMEEMAGLFPSCGMMGTMGYTIQSEFFSEESMDHDDNSVHFDILVDPAMASEDRYGSGDHQERILIKEKK